MNELQVLASEVPGVLLCSSERPYVLVRAIANEGGSSVDGDIEFVDEGSGAREIRVGVTERSGAHRAIVWGAVFDADDGALLRAGDSVSMARPLHDEIDRASAVAKVTLMLAGAVLVDTDQVQAAA